jgi:hypothetical protein
MGLEVRKKGVYYYKKRRVGSKVVSEYVGAGPMADLAAIEQAFENRDKERKKAQKEQEKAAFQDLNQPLKELDRLIGALTTATLIVNGYHTHKRQWRRERGRTANN